ncbi:MAG: hypothetical protein QM705_13525 [Ancrocorticia sp.]
MDPKSIDMRTAVKKIYVLAGILYVTSLILRIVGPFFMMQPSIVGEFNQPLASTLRFIFNELSMLVSPVAASFCLLTAIIMHVLLASRYSTSEDN